MTGWVVSRLPGMRPSAYGSVRCKGPWDSRQLVALVALGSASERGRDGTCPQGLVGSRDLTRPLLLPLPLRKHAPGSHLPFSLGPGMKGTGTDLTYSPEPSPTSNLRPRVRNAR